MSGYAEQHYNITQKEYEELDKQFGKLCHYAAWQIVRFNFPKIKYEQEFPNVDQEIVISVIRAASYYKRQIFLNKAFEFLNSIQLTRQERVKVTALQILWDGRKEKGNKNKFDKNEEEALVEVIKTNQNKASEKGEAAPTQSAPLQLNKEFTIYCKSIIWNTYKSIGKGITKSRKDRKHEVSLSEYDFLGESVDNNLIGMDDFGPSGLGGRLRAKLVKDTDSRVVETFDILTNPENDTDVFLKDKSKPKVKINVVRKKTKMSYKTIRKQVAKIKDVAAQVINE